MARVSQAHLDARRREILDAARVCFARDGFHAASMQDVFAESGLSAGACYRYFSSKEEIVAAIASETLAEVSAAFAAADRDLPLDEVITHALRAIERVDEEQGVGRLALQVWGEAVRSPALAERVAAAADEILTVLTAVVAEQQERGAIAADVAPEDIAKVLRSLLPGFLLQRTLLGGIDAERFRVGLGGLLGAPR